MPVTSLGYWCSGPSQSPDLCGLGISMPWVMGNERRQTHIQESRDGHRPWALMEMLLQAARKLNVDLGGRLANLGRGISLGMSPSLQSSLRRKLWIDPSAPFLARSELGPKEDIFIPLSHGSEVLGSLTWLCSSHQYTSPQDLILLPTDLKHEVTAAIWFDELW